MWLADVVIQRKYKAVSTTTTSSDSDMSQMYIFCGFVTKQE